MNVSGHREKKTLGDRLQKWKKGPRVYFLMTLIVVAILVTAFLFRQRDLRPGSVGMGEVSTNFAETLEKKSFDELKLMVEERFENLSQLELPIQIERLEQQFILADQMEGLRPSSKQYVDKVRLTAYTILDGYNVTHSLGRDELRNELIELCNELVNSDRDELVRDSFFAMTSVSVMDLCKAPSEETYEACKSVVDVSLDELGEDLAWINKLKLAFKVMQRGEIDQQRTDLLAHIGSRLLKSQDQDVRVQGLEYNAHAYFDTEQLALIDNTMRMEMDSAVKEFNSLCDQLTTHPNVASAVYRSAMAIYERNAAFCKSAGLDLRLADLESSVEKLVVPAVKRELASRLAKMRSRLLLLDREFQFSAETLDSEKITNSMYEGKPLLIVYFSFNQNESAVFLDDLAKSGFLEKYEVEMMGVLLDAPKPIHLEVIGKRFPGCKFVVNQKDPPIHKTFRVDSAPYVMLLDKQHQLTDIALDFVRIESVFAKRFPLPENASGE